MSNESVFICPVCKGTQMYSDLQACPICNGSGKITAALTRALAATITAALTRALEAMTNRILGECRAANRDLNKETQDGEQRYRK